MDMGGASKLGCGSLPRVVAARRVSAGEVLISRNMIRSTKAHLAAALRGADNEVHDILHGVSTLDNGGARMAESESTDFHSFWRVCQPAPDEDANGHTEWVLEDAPLVWMRHSSASATVRVMQLPNAKLPLVARNSGASYVYFRTAVDAGTEVTRDLAEPSGPPRSLSRAAAFLSATPQWRWFAAPERDALEAAVANARPSARQSSNPPRASAGMAGRGSNDHGDNSTKVELCAPNSAHARRRVYTDYPLWRTQLLSLPPSTDFAVTDSECDADIIWLITPLRNYSALRAGVLVNQFPFEGCLVRKDLLLTTCRYAATMRASLGPGARGGSATLTLAAQVRKLTRDEWPPWFLPAFDLLTQTHEFLDAHHHAAESAASLDATGNRNPAWIVKRATGTHSSDPCVTRDPLIVLRYGDPATPGGDRVVQMYAPRPMLLAGGRKFDLRVYVAVRSFVPLVAAYHTLYYARTAAAPYDQDGNHLDDFAAHYSVGFYEGVASGVLTRGALAEAAWAEAGVNWDCEVEPALAEALQELFTAAAAYIGGPWPQSRALYGVDVLLHWNDDGTAGQLPSVPTAHSGCGTRDRAVLTGTENRRLQPLILEVNFAGDITSLVARLPDDGSVGCLSDQRTFVSDVMEMLFADRDTSANSPASSSEFTADALTLPPAWRALTAAL